jgi:hypothetical protein
MKADLAFCGCMILWAVGFIGAELGVTPSDIKELVPTMTPTTITILAVAAYFAVGYGWSVVAYVKQARYREAWQEKNPDIRPGDYNDWQIPASPATVACFVSLAWLPFGLALCIGYTIYGAFVFATRPHRYFAALVKKLNTPAPVQVSGAFAKGLEEGRGGYLASDPMERFTHGGRIWEPVSITSSFPGESFMSCRAVDDTESGKQAR